MKRFLLFVIYYLSTWTANAYESLGQVHRPEKVNQCTCRFEPVSL